MIDEINELFKEDLVFIEQGKNSSEILTKVGKKLIHKKLVKNDFIKEIIKREQEYPTGIDLSVVHNDKNIPNIAVPHTEIEYCNCKNIVVVKLKNDVKFKNMISPEKDLNVKFLFMILNNKQKSQANILSNIMKFVTQIDNIKKLCNAKNTIDIYRCITR